MEADSQMQFTSDRQVNIDAVPDMLHALGMQDIAAIMA